MGFYHYESDPCLLLNLEADKQFLLERKQAIEEQIRKLTIDLTVLNNVLDLEPTTQELEA